MNISHVRAACYQHIEVSDTCNLVRTLLCFDVGILRFGFQQFKCKKAISDTSWQMVNQSPVYVLYGQSGNQDYQEDNYNHCYWVLSISCWRSS
jgi:hypothetical protein